MRKSSKIILITGVILVIIVVLSIILFTQESVESTQPFTSRTPGTTTYIAKLNRTTSEAIEEIKDKIMNKNILNLKLVVINNDAILSELLKSSIEINSSWLIIIDSEWLVQNKNNTMLHELLKKSLYSGASIVTIGSSTSSLFETLINIGIYKGRNPVYFNPPAAGYKLVKTTLPVYNEPYYGDIVFTSNTSNIDELVEAILTFWGGSASNENTSTL